MAKFAYDGEDVKIFGARASHFGDPSDKEDNGVGKWGFNYRSRPDFPGIALPRVTWMRFGLKQYHPVKAYYPHNQREIFLYFIDEGPATRTGRDADLLIQPWVYFGYDLTDNSPDDILIDLRIFDPPLKPDLG